MSEIVCPSCQSRYQIPEGAIGPEGRKVKCASCSHVWLAVPEVAVAGDVEPAPVVEASEPPVEQVAEAPVEAEASQSSFEDRLAALRGELQEADAAAGHEAEGPAQEDQDSVEESRFLEPEPQAGRPDYADDDKAYDDPHEVEGNELEVYGDDEMPVEYEDTADEVVASDKTAEAAESVAAAPSVENEYADEDYSEYDENSQPVAASVSPELEGERKGQMDEIRQMLDDLQSEDVARPDDAPEYGANLERPDPIPSRPYEEDEYRDPLKERLAEVSGGAAIPGFKKNAKQKDYDRGKLIKKHQRRYRRKRSAELSKRPSPFTTGFMLIVMVAMIMGAVYLLHPQIIQRLPQTEPAMLDYVEFIDGLRVVVGEKIDSLRGMIDEAIEKAA